MIDKSEAKFTDTPEGADVLLLLDAINRGSRVIIEAMAAFPDRFDDPKLHAEASLISSIALREFTDELRAAMGKRLANRRQ